MNDPSKGGKDWRRMHPLDAKKGGYIKCEICAADFKFAVENDYDVIVTIPDGDVIGVCIK